MLSRVSRSAATFGAVTEAEQIGGAGMLFDLDGTLVDSVYQHVLAWREALEESGIDVSVWSIHRRIGMSGGLFANALLRETGAGLDPGARAIAHGSTPRPSVAMRRAVRPLPGARRAADD